MEEIKLKADYGFIPDGTYVLSRNIRGFGKVNGKAIVKDGIFTLLKGSICGNTGTGPIPFIRKNAKIVNNILQEDIICSSPSGAGFVVIGNYNNGWQEWQDLDGYLTLDKGIFNITELGMYFIEQLLKYDINLFKEKSVEFSKL